ncbi:hypothetical protein BDFB_011786, partial [Asbolus verrucosus]
MEAKIPHFGIWMSPKTGYCLNSNYCIIACTVLHNIARKIGEDEPPLADGIDAHELQLITRGFIPNVATEQANAGFGTQDCCHLNFSPKMK